jgi:hypothetical protein
MNRKIFVFTYIVFILINSSLFSSELRFVFSDKNIDSDQIILNFELYNESSKDSFIIITDPWIREGWDQTGSFYNLMVDPIYNYPFIQLINIKSKMTVDVSRNYLLNQFENFLLIEPKSFVRCSIFLELENKILSSCENDLKVLIIVPYANYDKFTSYKDTKETIRTISQKDSIDINLVSPGHYIYYTKKEKQTDIPLTHIFNKSTGGSKLLSDIVK